MSNSINRLPTGPLATIGSFLSERDLSSNFSIVNKAFNDAAKDAQLVYHYPEIQSCKGNSYLGRIATRVAAQPLIDSEDGRVEQVRRVRQIAEKRLRANLHVLQHDDRQTLRINENTPVSDFSYRQINVASIIMPDRCLLKGIVEIPILHGLIQVGNSLSQNAAILRNWLANIPNDLDPELLHDVLYAAAKSGNLEIVQAILQTDRAIDPHQLGHALCKAAELGNLEIVQAILQSGHAIDPQPLGHALCKAAELGNLEIVQALLQSEHAIAFHGLFNGLGHALCKAVEIKNLEMVQALLQNEYFIDSQTLGHALSHAVEIGLGVVLSDAAEIKRFEIVQAILQNGRAIAPQGLGWALLRASELGYPKIVQAIFQSGHAIDPVYLGRALYGAVQDRDPAAVQAILQSRHAIDPQWRSRAQSDAVNSEDPEIVRAFSLKRARISSTEQDDGSYGHCLLS